MTPKEKAKELMDTIFYRTYHIKSEDAKQCALITVDEILSNEKIELPFNKRNQIYFCDIEYWQEVRKEIENL